jgi:hypothetical protein
LISDIVWDGQWNTKIVDKPFGAVASVLKQSGTLYSPSFNVIE